MKSIYQKWTEKKFFRKHIKKLIFRPDITNSVFQMNSATIEKIVSLTDANQTIPKITHQKARTRMMIVRVWAGLYICRKSFK